MEIVLFRNKLINIIWDIIIKEFGNFVLIYGM